MSPISEQFLDLKKKLEAELDPNLQPLYETHRSHCFSKMGQALEGTSHLSIKDQLAAIRKLLHLPLGNHCCEICDKIMDEIHDEDGSTQGNIDKMLFMSIEGSEDRKEATRLGTSQSFAYN